ncbi:alpha/beta hydrolase [Pseudonocardia bannensis]|uniref:Alpha/beta hydrolase n=1 Tax=Pseudonocardia bannensis TaxID=630973 RepID=A0A848DQ51_9PSEU|nr:alpha/beta hydrolase [Pseudonocardia bannensis]NMH94653.1 alpha/beta hydrolase [Pseudonocardia bannensis]
MTSPPTLVLVHGAWHGPWAWDRLVDELAGVEVRRVALPSVGPDPAALGDLYADAVAVRSVVAGIDGPVVVCAHSYGGAPVTEGVADLPNVAGLVYVCAFQLDVGDSLAAAVGGAPPDWWDVHEAEGYVDTLRPREIFYADVDEAAAEASIAQLGHQSLVALGQPLTKAAWRGIPSTYVVCEQDNAIPVIAQEAMAQHSKRVLRLPTSHSPFLSRPAELAQILRAELSAATP